MPGIPGVPLSQIPSTATPNPDLPATAFPSLPRISVIDLVGPLAANKQHQALEKRDETIRVLANLLTTAMNAVAANFLQRDGTVQSDSTTGILGNMAMNGFRFTGMAASTTNGHAVEHSQLVAEAAARAAADAGLQSQINLKASLASPALTGTPTAPTPTPGDNSTRLATTEFVSTAVSGIAALPIPNYNVNGDGANISAGGSYYYNNLNVVSPQACVRPVRIRCAGDCTIGAAITSSYPIELEVRGTLTINATISAPYISIRCIGPCNINAQVSTHVATGDHQWKWGRLLPSLTAHPGYPLDDLIMQTVKQMPWRALLIDAAGNITTGASGQLRGDDVFIKAGGNITLGAHIYAAWWYSGSDAYLDYTWFDGYRVTGQAPGSFTNRGGHGGTGGGWARGGSSASASWWRGETRLGMWPCYDYSRGGVGINYNTAYRGVPGGRLSIYAAGNISAVGVNVSARGWNADGSYGPAGSPGGSGQGAGGGGTVRGAAGGSISGGNWDAGGGLGNGSQEEGAGGGVFLLATSYGTAPTLDVSATSQGVTGTSEQLTVAAGVVTGLAARGVFDVFPPTEPLRY